MLPNNTPLTTSQSDFAAEHHNLIYAYLRRRRLPVDDYYDVVVFGYLSAVRDYHTRENLRSWTFPAIAYQYMRRVLFNYWRSIRRFGSWDMLPLDFGALQEADSNVESEAISTELNGRVERCMTPRQGEIIRLRTKGYSLREIQNTCCISYARLRKDIGALRDNVLPFLPELKEAA